MRVIVTCLKVSIYYIDLYIRLFVSYGLEYSKYRWFIVQYGTNAILTKK